MEMTIVRLMAVVNLLVLLDTIPANCQIAEIPWAIGDHRARVVFPTADVDSALAESILDALHEISYPGLPPAARSSRGRLTVTFGDLRDGVEAIARPEALLIVLSRAAVGGWHRDRLRRVLRHEATHVALHRYLDWPSIPEWIDEGLAEWAAGGATCDGAGRIYVHLQENPDFRVVDMADLEQLSVRLAYDFYVLFWEFLASTAGARIANGTFVEALERDGGLSAVDRVFKAPLDDLVLRWWASFLRGAVDEVLERCARGS